MKSLFPKHHWRSHNLFETQFFIEKRRIFQEDGLDSIPVYEGLDPTLDPAYEKGEEVGAGFPSQDLIRQYQDAFTVFDAAEYDQQKEELFREYFDWSEDTSQWVPSPNVKGKLRDHLLNEFAQDNLDSTTREELEQFFKFFFTEDVDLLFAERTDVVAEDPYGNFGHDPAPHGEQLQRYFHWWEQDHPDEDGLSDHERQNIKSLLPLWWTDFGVDIKEKKVLHSQMTAAYEQDHSVTERRDAATAWIDAMRTNLKQVEAVDATAVGEAYDRLFKTTANDRNIQALAQGLDIKLELVQAVSGGASYSPIQDKIITGEAIDGFGQLALFRQKYTEYVKAERKARNKKDKENFWIKQGRAKLPVEDDLRTLEEDLQEVHQAVRAFESAAQMFLSQKAEKEAQIGRLALLNEIFPPASPPQTVSEIDQAITLAKKILADPSDYDPRTNMEEYARRKQERKFQEKMISFLQECRSHAQYWAGISGDKALYDAVRGSDHTTRRSARESRALALNLVSTYRLITDKLFEGLVRPLAIGLPLAEQRLVHAYFRADARAGADDADEDYTNAQAVIRDRLKQENNAGTLLNYYREMEFDALIFAGIQKPKLNPDDLSPEVIETVEKYLRGLVMRGIKSPEAINTILKQAQNPEQLRAMYLALYEDYQKTHK